MGKLIVILVIYRIGGFVGIRGIHWGLPLVSNCLFYFLAIIGGPGFCFVVYLVGIVSHVGRCRVLGV